MEVLATLTSDVGRIFSKMHLVQPKGEINLLTGIRIAHVSNLFTQMFIYLFIYINFTITSFAISINYYKHEKNLIVKYNLIIISLNQRAQ